MRKIEQSQKEAKEARQEGDVETEEVCIDAINDLKRILELYKEFKRLELSSSVIDVKLKEMEEECEQLKNSLKVQNINEVQEKINTCKSKIQKRKGTSAHDQKLNAIDQARISKLERLQSLHLEILN